MYKVGILTASDKGSKGERMDVSGQTIKDILGEKGFELIAYQVVPDDLTVISETLIQWADALGLELILTTGGTGFSQRDITPEATLKVIERQTPGISEAMRYKSLSITPKGMLSRGVSGIRGRTLIVNLPGSPKAVKECLTYAIDAMAHGLDILLSRDQECGSV